MSTGGLSPAKGDHHKDGRSLLALFSQQTGLFSKKNKDSNLIVSPQSVSQKK
jgi:hypothetical protein